MDIVFFGRGDQMRINFIVPPLGQSGGTMVVQRYVNELDKRGHDVRVYLPLTGLGLHRYSGKLMNCAHDIYSFFKGIIEIAKHPEKGKFVFSGSSRSIRDADVIIATAWPTAYLVNNLPNSKGKKFYFVQDFEVWDNQRLGLGSYQLPLKKIVISNWINQQLISNLGIGPFPIVYNGLDMPSESLASHKDPYAVLMLNHSLEKKGIPYGVDAFRKAQKKIPTLHLTMFGLNDQSNLPQDLHIDYYQNPSQRKLNYLYDISSVFIFPSIEEGWGMTPLEAMAHGDIVVGTDAGFANELGRDKFNMLKSKPKDPIDMANNIIELVNNNHLQTILRKNALNTVAELNWDNSVTRFEKLLQ